MNNQQPTDSRVSSFLHMLRQQPSEADCDRCQAQLYDYAEAQLAREDVRQRFGWAAEHLDSCLECSAAYGRLYDLLHADEAGLLPVPATLPQPDLSFLASQPSLAEMLQTAVRQIGQQLTLRLTSALAAQLTPTSTATPVRSSGDGRYSQKLLELTPSQLPADICPFTLTAFADGQQPDGCLIEINVEPPDLSWPDLADQAVTLATPSQTHIAQTDEWGTAVFPNIPRADLPNLTIEIITHPTPS